MKTAKSITKNDLGKLLVDLTISHIDQWANHQFENIRQSNNIVCVPISNSSWYVGPYQLDELGPHKWNLSLDKDSIQVFYSKHAALLYAILARSMNPWHAKIAHDLLNSDHNAGVIHDDLSFYTKKLTKKDKKVDQFKQQLWTARFYEVKVKMNLALRDLEKNLRSAKYIKVWDGN